jgi:hypothetical protein
MQDWLPGVVALAKLAAKPKASRNSTNFLLISNSTILPKIIPRLVLQVAYAKPVSNRDHRINSEFENV